MSCSKPLPPFTFDVLCYSNRDQLERLSIVCRPLKNLINRYFGAKPYRIFDRLYINEGSCALYHKDVQWHPNREDYSVQQFLAGQKCSIDESKLFRHSTYYSFAEMRPYLGPTVRINEMTLYVAASTFNPEHIAEMESIEYLWRDANVYIRNASYFDGPIVAEDFQSILNSPTILKCQSLWMSNAHFSFKDYKILYTVKVIQIRYDRFIRDNDIALWLQYWQQFLEQPGVKPIVAFWFLYRQNIDGLLDRLSQDFSSAVLPNAFKIVFHQLNKPLTQFRETNNASGEILELKKGFPLEYPNKKKYFRGYGCYTLERSSI